MSKKIKKNISDRIVFFGILFFLISFIDIFSIYKKEKLSGIKKIISIFLISLFLGYGITLKWKLSFIFSIALTLSSLVLDTNKIIIRERFDSLEPAGDMVKDKGNIGIAKTDDKDETHFDDEDLDKILEKDENFETPSEKVTGIKQIDDILESAKNESPHSDKNKKTNSYTPAEAQRATFHLIDTVKQLKETMTSMMPLMQVGNNLIKLHKNMGGDELVKTLKK